MKRIMSLYFVVLSFTILFLFSACSQKKIDFNRVQATKHTSLARQKATLKSYIVKGHRYTPVLVKKGDTQYGVSSWYGPNFHGKRTSNGEIYNMHGRTAAHKIFPMDTIVRVDNLENGRHTIVRINDRGPFVDGRIIDCSYLAGKELGLDKTGIAKVKVTVLGRAGKVHKKTYPKPSYTKVREIIKYKKSPTPREYTASKLLGVQLGAYRALNGAVMCSKKYRNYYVGYKPIIKKVVDTHAVPLYRVWLVGFKTPAELHMFKEKQRRITERM